MKCNVCSFNIRYDVQQDGKNCFEFRRELIRREFPKYEADIIGFQEVLPHVRAWLEENLTEYTFVGTGRNADFGGEHVCIGYRTAMFTLVSLDTFWLSDTPRVPGSRFGTGQSGCPRICTVAVLLRNEDRKLIRMYNTHLDHVGVLAQAQGMSMVLSRMAADEALYPGSEIVLTGDFNIQPDSPIIAGIGQFTVGGRGLTDVTAQVGDTFHCYNPTKPMMKIDYIYTTASCDVSRSLRLTDEENGVYFSDHYPVLAELEL